MPDLLSFSLQRKPFMKCQQTLALIPKSLVDPAPFILMSVPYIHSVRYRTLKWNQQFPILFTYSFTT